MGLLLLLKVYEYLEIEEEEDLNYSDYLVIVFSWFKFLLAFETFNFVVFSKDNRLSF